MNELAAWCGVFLAVLFLQSGLDKVLDRSGAVAHWVEVTSRGPLRRWAKAWLNLVTLLEVLAGSASAAGVILWFLDGRNPVLTAGAFFSALAVVVLFFVQRLNRDEPGAARQVGYFLVALLALHANLG